MPLLRFFYTLFFLLISCLYINSVYAKTHYQNIPFLNLALNKDDVNYGKYSFGTFGLLFCYDNTTQNVGQIIWQYKGKKYSSHLPIFLKTNARFQGEWIDPNGTIYINNNAGKAIVISCQFAY